MLIFKKKPEIFIKHNFKNKYFYMSDTRILSGSICASICSLCFALLTSLLIERRFRAQNVCHLRHMYREACCWLTLVAFGAPPTWKLRPPNQRPS